MKFTKQEKRLRRKIFNSMKRQRVIDLKVRSGELLMPELESFGNDDIPDDKIEKAVKKAIPRLLKMGVIVPDDQLLFSYLNYIR